MLRPYTIERPETQKQDLQQSTTFAISPSFMTYSDPNIFDVTPQSLLDAPTLTAILEKQTKDPTISKRIFSVYPDANSSYLEISYRDFGRLVNATAANWHERLSPFLGPTSNVKDILALDHPVVAILSDTGFSLTVAIMAVLKLNVTAFLLSPANSEPALVHLLDSCKVSALIYGSNYASTSVPAAAKCSVQCFPLETVSQHNVSDLFNEDRGHLALRPAPPEIPIILHSSGSTSFPKPVYWSHTSFLANSQVHYTSGGWSAFTKPNNRFLCLGPVFHSMGITLGLGGTICAGSTVVFPLAKSWPPSPNDVVNSLRLGNVNSCVMVPSLLEQVALCLRDTQASTTSNHLDVLLKLRILLVGGAHCPDHLAEYLVSNGVNLRYVYGSTEAGHMMVGSHERQVHGDSTSWKLLKPMPHTSLIFKPVTKDDSFGGRNLYEVRMSPRDARLAPGVLAPGQESWNTGDVVEEVPPGSGWYKLLFREDDILVHDSGEKTNPIAMEESTRSCEIIDRMVVVGHRRPVNAAIIQLNPEKADKYSGEERANICLKAIRTANAAAPKHSRIMDEMILILPISYNKRIPVTNKGNFIRPKVVEIFSDEIELLYSQFVEGKNSPGTPGPALSLETIQRRIQKILDELLASEKAYNIEENFFDVVLDSVTAMSFRNRLSRDFGVALSPNFVYQNFSISRLAVALAERTGAPNGVMNDGIADRQNVLRSLFERQLLVLRHSAQLIHASRDEGASISSEGRVVAVVGATGSLGIWQVKMLLDSPDVAKVVCLGRGTSTSCVYDKLMDALARVSLGEVASQMKEWKEGQLSQPDKLVLDLNQRLVVVPFDLSKPHFETKDFVSLARGLTTIIHTGWKMDFNQVSQSFEDCLTGTTQLLLLAGFIRPKAFYFISSIGTVMEMAEKPVLEALAPWSNGGTLATAASSLNIPCAIARIGQITGNTVSGFWKSQEMNPIVISGSIRVGKYPDISMLVDWIPVDTVAASTIELALKTNLPSETSIYHITNPVPSQYSDIMHYLQALGYTLSPASPIEWWEAIAADSGNPCHIDGGLYS
ncbi:acetyl-CoA synthetase-like protein [Gymnopus androsaceus JB14]|uniref:Acetyl-CoA synthetase-like protein n=1 Tax=Gymnopus androsaceus JB14 TaxID=1447944 RepID=A0A6A4H3Q2_9AGAR|nr:acetyl-CoA synthetase-like protein [Gymnopus androsaceus JB14]